MIFAWSPPFVITPWMRAPVWICWRMASSALKSEMTALSALTPRHGHDDARAVLLEELREPGVRLLLLERELGGFVDAVREPFEVIGEAVDGLGHLWSDGLGAAHFAASNSRRASLTSAGLASRSHVVIAMILADVSIPSRASGVTAACSNAREWIGVPSGAIWTMGWMAGMTWLTLPTSELPMRSRLSGDSTTPNVLALARNRSSSVRLRRIGSYALSGFWITLSVLPVAVAAPSAHATTRFCRAHMSSSAAART